MMKLLGKILLTLSTLLCLLIIVGYFFIQSPFGVTFLNRHLADYGFQVDKVSYDLHKPYEIVFNHARYTNLQQGLSFNLEQVEIGFATLFQLKNPDYLILKQGSIKLNESQLATLPQLRRLQLIGVDVQIGDRFQAIGVNGGLLENKNEFTFSAKTVNLADIELKNGFVKGRYFDQQWLIDNMGADIAGGYFVAKGRRYNDGHWLFDSLQFGNIKSTDGDLDQLWQRYMKQLPDIVLNHLELTNLEIDSPRLKLSGFDADFNHIAVKQGKLELNDSRLTLNANHFIYADELELTKLNLQASIVQNLVTIKSFTTDWQQGLVKASGLWDRQQKKLTLDSLTLLGINYVLPESLPWHNKQLNELTIGLLTITPSIVVGLQNDFPFQFTYLTGAGYGLTLIKQGQLGLWAGNGNLSADSGTLNSIGLRHLSLNFSQTEQLLKIDNLSALTDNGVIDSQLTLAQPIDEQNSHPIQQLQLSAKNVSAAILDKWQLAEGLQLKDDAQIELQLEQGKGIVNLQTPSENTHYNVQNYHVMLEDLH